MATWNQITKGKRARRRVVLPLGSAPALPPTVAQDGSLHVAPQEGAIPLDLRILTPGEQADVLSRARSDALAKGVEEPRDGNPIYDLAEMEHTLLLACIDPDSPQDAPRPFFGSISEIRSSPELTRDHVVYLFELVQQFHDECSPRRRRVGVDELLVGMLSLANDNEDEARLFFESLGPGLRWIFMRTLACLWSISQTDKSSPGSPSGTKETGSSKTPQKPATAVAPARAENL